MENIIAINLMTQSNGISSPSTTTSRNGNGTFCSIFNGRSIADKGSGGKDIVDW